MLITSTFEKRLQRKWVLCYLWLFLSFTRHTTSAYCYKHNSFAVPTSPNSLSARAWQSYSWRVGQHSSARLNNMGMQAQTIKSAGLFKKGTGDNATIGEIQSLYSLPPNLAQLVMMFRKIPGGAAARSKHLVLFGQKCPPMNEVYKTLPNQVMGCQSTVFVRPEVYRENNITKVRWTGDSDGLLTRGLLHILIKGLSGCTVADVLAVNPDFISATYITQFLAMSRINGFMNMVKKMQTQCELIRQMIDS